eukprot:24150-Pyramimonas_sp.AAC.1
MKGPRHPELYATRWLHSKFTVFCHLLQQDCREIDFAAAKSGVVALPAQVLVSTGKHESLFRQVHDFASIAARAARSVPDAKDLLARIASAAEAETLVAKAN